MKGKIKTNWIGVLTIIMAAILLGFIGLSLPDTINKMNGLSSGSMYGIWGSYVVVILLFQVLTFDISLTKEVKE